ncbi:HEAT repeat-containing protein 5B-like [Zophobas morio]|uniref:HEAT repeat-containing protein 5B-like n=1 Tax=Zophobas morio TaxID=2755281 RepID=UPI003083017A
MGFCFTIVLSISASANNSSVEVTIKLIKNTYQKLLKYCVFDITAAYKNHTTLLSELCDFYHDCLVIDNTLQDFPLFLALGNNCIENLEEDSFQIIPLTEQSAAASEDAVVWLTSNGSKVAVLDAAIYLFGAVFPFCQSKYQLQLIDYLVNHFYEKKKATANVQLNILVAILAVFRQLLSNKVAFNITTLKRLLPCFREALSSTNPKLRIAASQCYGHLAFHSVPSFISETVDFLVALLRTDRDAVHRTGLALSLATVIKLCRRTAEWTRKRTVVSLLIALSKDLEKTVQVWALHGLWYMLEGAVLNG